VIRTKDMWAVQPDYFGAERRLADLHGPTGVGFTGDMATAGVFDAANVVPDGRRRRSVRPVSA
jgi:hypothetical protein